MSQREGTSGEMPARAEELDRVEHARADLVAASNPIDFAKIGCPICFVAYRLFSSASALLRSVRRGDAAPRGSDSGRSAVDVSPGRIV